MAKYSFEKPRIIFAFFFFLVLLVESRRIDREIYWTAVQVSRFASKPFVLIIARPQS